MEKDLVLDMEVEGAVESALNEIIEAPKEFQQPQQKRTKIIFLYSSDDDDDDKTKSENKERKIETECTVLNPPLEELQVMQQEAEEAMKEQQQNEGNNNINMDNPMMPLFMEDTSGENLSKPIPHNRVKVVDALPLREYNDNNNNYIPLRRRLQLEEAARLSHARKRFREEEDEEEETKESKEELYEEAVEGEESEMCKPQPVLDNDGLVRAIVVSGYQLTVDECELQDLNNDNNINNSQQEELETKVNPNDVDGEYINNIDENNNYDYDEDEDEEYEEEDEELDAALVVAVVEQLVRCCESEELDEVLRDDGHSFLTKVKPLLQELHESKIDEITFGESVKGEVLRLQRAFRRACKPKDAPIIINGVQMDM